MKMIIQSKAIAGKPNQGKGKVEQANPHRTDIS